MGWTEPPQVKVYGERNSGTNLLEQVIALNFHAELLPGTIPAPLARAFPHGERLRDAYFRVTGPWNLGWKHALPPGPERLSCLDQRRGPRFAAIVKNPYSFLLSLHRRPHHARCTWRSLGEFLATPWPTLGREGAAGAIYANPIELWCAKARSYLALAAGAHWALTLRYEDLLADLPAVCGTLRDRLQLAPRGGSFRPVVESTKGDPIDFDGYRRHYLEGRWREELDAGTVETINASLDPGLLGALGYPVEPPSAFQPAAGRTSVVTSRPRRSPR